MTTKTPAQMVPAGKPRNRLAVDPLLRKSGAHDDVRRKRKRASEQDFADTVDALRRDFLDRRRGDE